MNKWLCSVCDMYIYDEEKEDLRFSDLPFTWRCPVCGVGKDKFVPTSEEEYRSKEKSFFPGFHKKGILIGVDNPITISGFKQEYGIPLGLRGIGQGSSYLNNFRALARYRLKTSLITDYKDPICETTFLGKKVSMPLLGAPMSGLSYVSNITEEDFAYNILEGCRLAETIGFTGTTAKNYETHPGIVAIRRVNGHGVNIFKPQSQEILLELIKQSEKENAIAVGVDIDGAGSVNFALAGKPVFRKTIDELRELKKSTKLPFVVKGIMCEKDALSAIEAGADVICVSNHGGRVLDSTPGVAEVLYDIVNVIREKEGGKKGEKETKKEGKRDITITVDGGVRSGFDVIKMLALGADFVMVGRPLATSAVPGGAIGVKTILEYLKTDIKIAMIMTSCNTLEDINDKIITKDG